MFQSNARRVVSVVGTRRCTRYGQDLIHSFVHRLKELCPEVLVVSGLAYGVDIWAHRECLANEMPTVGVLAHGLDDLYPRAHRETANMPLLFEKLKNGTLGQFVPKSDPAEKEEN